MKSELLLGVISDTHGLVRPAVYTHFEDVAAILHAGDVGDDEVARELASIAPLYAVAGNMDDGLKLPVERREELGGWRLFISHFMGKPDKPPPQMQRVLAEFRPHLFVFGHTHLQYARSIDGVTYLNPGAAGPSRFGIKPSIAVVRLVPELEPEVRFIPLG